MQQSRLSYDQNINTDLIQNANRTAQFERIANLSCHIAKKHMEVDIATTVPDFVDSCEWYHKHGFYIASHLSALCTLELWYGQKFVDHPLETEINNLICGDLEPANKLKKIKELIRNTPKEKEAI